jgi:hypothetical protein
MRIDVRPAARLRGPEPVDIAGLLGPIVDSLRASSIDLSRVRVVCDWIQYRSSFREVADLRAILPAPFPADAADPEIELAIDLRHSAAADLRMLVTGLLAEHAGTQPSARLALEPWVAGTASCIWRFNSLYWQALSAWEQATGREYERALPGGQSEVRNVAAVRELILELFKVWDDLDARGALPLSSTSWSWEPATAARHGPGSMSSSPCPGRTAGTTTGACTTLWATTPRTC